MQNAPFFAKGLSYLDTVEVKIEVDDLVFFSVQWRGGHSTYRLILEESTADEQFAERWKLLASLGCTYESFGDLRLRAVDVPTIEVVKAAYPLLQAGERDGIWVFEEGHYAGNP